ncbi:unnamed protein product [Nesidiocoris tenuis]|uniref:Uncharacterized protein n=1 Tax=Nesidiocoris tenuis TaxID=355587 RepID=A0A6H5H9U8_9HEMI|nr:unnamed protein product [Nesidiocoris tenuis]
MGVMEILCDLLTFGIGTKTEEETAVHIYVILGLLTDAGRDRDVIGNVVDAGGIECLVKMTRSESVLMQAEAFLALHLTAAIRGTDAEPSLLKANIGEAITEFLVASPQREIFQNLLAIIGLIISSGELNSRLSEI